MEQLLNMFTGNGQQPLDGVALPELRTIPNSEDDGQSLGPRNGDKRIPRTDENTASQNDGDPGQIDMFLHKHGLNAYELAIETAPITMYTEDIQQLQAAQKLEQQ